VDLHWLTARLLPTPTPPPPASTARLPANLLQAQRDYFGAHTYERLDTPGEFVHTNWTGRGGDVASSTYNA
jgi:6-phosphogluconate dehydrogenase